MNKHLIVQVLSDCHHLFENHNTTDTNYTNNSTTFNDMVDKILGSSKSFMIDVLCLAGNIGHLQNDYYRQFLIHISLFHKIRWNHIVYVLGSIESENLKGSKEDHHVDYLLWLKQYAPSVTLLHRTSLVINDLYEIYGITAWIPPISDYANCQVQRYHSYHDMQHLFKYMNSHYVYSLNTHSHQNSQKRIRIILTHFSPFQMKESIQNTTWTHLWKDCLYHIQKYPSHYKQHLWICGGTEMNAHYNLYTAHFYQERRDSLELWCHSLSSIRNLQLDNNVIPTFIQIYEPSIEKIV